MANTRIMVVDDDPDTLDVVSAILKVHGYEAVTLNTGQNLIEKISELIPKLILLDVQLGSFDGRFLCKKIKEIEEYAAIPVILFSANSNYGKNVKEYLCDNFISKPFELAALIEMMKRYTESLN